MTPFRFPSHYDLGRHTSVPDNRETPRRVARTPRILLAGGSDEHTAVDGAWWPRTTDLANEVHDLATALTLRLGPVAHIAFAWEETSATQRLVEDESGIALSTPVPGQPPNVMYVVGENGNRMALFVIAASTVADRGYDTMRHSIDSAR